LSLLDGAHRTALAAVLKLKLPVAVYATDHKWPDWGVTWFNQHMPDRLPDILDDFERFCGD
jgi:hypothetical protein